MKNTALAFLVLGLLTLSCHTDARAAQKTDAPAKASAVQIDPASMREYTAKLDGFDRTWKVYVPKRCEGVPSPMVVGLHGFGRPQRVLPQRLEYDSRTRRFHCRIS